MGQYGQPSNLFQQRGARVAAACKGPSDHRDIHEARATDTSDGRIHLRRFSFEFLFPKQEKQELLGFSIHTTTGRWTR